MLGEYGTVSGTSASDIMDQLCSITETQNVSDAVRGYLLSAFGKLVTHSNSRLTPAAEEAQHTAKMSANPDLQQRALELEALLRSFTDHTKLTAAQMIHTKSCSHKALKDVSTRHATMMKCIFLHSKT